MEWIISPTSIPTPPGGCVANGCAYYSCPNNCSTQCIINTGTNK